MSEPSLWYRLGLPTRHHWINAGDLDEPGISNVAEWRRCLCYCRHCGGERRVWWQIATDPSKLNRPGLTSWCRLDPWPRTAGRW